MKKSKAKLAFSKKTIASLESILGGFQQAQTSYESCPGQACPTERKTCAENGPCEDTIQMPIR
ncbi:hypothetical protein KORDIASMS9_01332 [Kordia sp. SMS9]|uniref:hypothetical protein n=1 Tax=Kordia sp. SMS9 TaxID=2282170 RepID=UPI000E0DD592|nr:hypothetical protein [Kordia sp. SMS9]AXG69113.1 hypothetical protein KORDIASMS9_01332 [Kordia sp. SMS9]